MTGQTSRERKMTHQDMTPQQRRRYNRHLILDGFGLEGQQRLLKAKVLIVGLGGLGSPVAQYLAAAGVGHLGLLDGDIVSLNNLQRQVIHDTSDIGTQKVRSAAQKILALNPDVQTTEIPLFLSEDNALDIIRDYDFVIDGTDNFSTKYLVNDACVMLGKPFCIGGINRYAGQVMTHLPGTACYRCLFPEPPEEKDVETCSMVGVLGPIAGMLGTVQATEAIKCIAGIGNPLTDSLLTFDALTMQWNTFRFQHDAECALCGDHPSITELHEYAFMPCSKRGV